MKNQKIIPFILLMLIPTGCHVSKTPIETVTEQNAITHDVAPKSVFSSMPAFLMMYSNEAYDVVLHASQDYLESIETAAKLYTRIDKNAHLSRVTVIFGDEQTIEGITYRMVDVASESHIDHYGIVSLKAFRETEESGNIYQFTESNKTLVAKLSDIPEPQEDLPPTLTGYKSTKEMHQFKFMLPEYPWRTPRISAELEGVIEVEDVENYFASVIMPEFKDDTKDEDENEDQDSDISYQILYHGTTQIEGNKAAVFSLRRKDDSFHGITSTIAMVGMTLNDDKTVYRYIEQPYYLTTLPNNVTADECQAVQNRDHFDRTPAKTFYYPHFSLRVSDLSFKKGTLPVTTAATALSNYIHAQKSTLPVIKTMSLEIEDKHYSLVLNTGIKPVFTAYNDFQSKDLIKLQLDGVTTVEGQDAYLFSLNKTAFGHEDPTTNHFAVTQDKKLYTFNYVPVKRGTLHDVKVKPSSSSSAPTTLFTISYDDTRSCSIVITTMEYTYVPCMTMQYLSQNDVSSPTKEICDDVQRISDYIHSNYLWDLTFKDKSEQDWRIVLDHLTDYNGETATVVLLGYINDHGDIDIIKQFLVTASGSVYSYDDKDQPTYIGSLN